MFWKKKSPELQTHNGITPKATPHQGGPTITDNDGNVWEKRVSDVDGPNFHRYYVVYKRSANPSGIAKIYIDGYGLQEVYLSSVLYKDGKVFSWEPAGNVSRLH